MQAAVLGDPRPGAKEASTAGAAPQKRAQQARHYSASPAGAALGQRPQQARQAQRTQRGIHHLVLLLLVLLGRHAVPLVPLNLGLQRQDTSAGEQSAAIDVRRTGLPPAVQQPALSINQLHSGRAAGTPPHPPTHPPYTPTSSPCRSLSDSQVLSA